MTKITGLVAATFTPLKDNFDINFDLIPPLIEYYKAEGITGIFICGTTGEGISMTIEERKQVAQAFVEASAGELLTFVHVGHGSLKEAQGLASHAVSIGADKISAVMPNYFPISDTNTLLKSMAMIANAAPEIPFFYYDIPALTSYNHDMLQFMVDADEHIENFGGIKFTSVRLDTYLKCKVFDGGIHDILYGYDELMINALISGAEGFIGSTFNFMPHLYLEIIKAYQEGDFQKARDYQLKAIDVIRLIPKYGGLRMQKEMMKFSGFDLGPVRLPLNRMSSLESHQLKEDLEKIGYQMQPV